MNKKTITATVALLSLLISQITFAQKKQFLLTGQLTNCTDSLIYLGYGTLNTSFKDSAVVKNGRFTFTGTVSEPVPAMIFTKTFKVQINLFLDNAPITVTGNADSMYSSVVTSKSPVVQEYEAFNQQIMANRKSTIALFQQVYALRQQGDTVLAKELEAKADSQYRWEFAAKKEYIETHPSSYISVHELLQYTSSNTLQESIRLFSGLDASVKASNAGKELADRIDLLSKVDVGKPAINFTQVSVDGKPVQLSDFKGRYVLLEFWASWCGPCRAENPNLVKQYHLYKDKGFDVLGVSLDNNKELWKQAIEKDGLPWTHVSDLNGWKNAVAEMYGIRAVPASFLIDPSGTIIAQGLRGESLNEKLEELFGKQ
jgi:peroxiredoxin